MRDPFRACGREGRDHLSVFEKLALGNGGWEEERPGRPLTCCPGERGARVAQAVQTGKISRMREKKRQMGLSF